MIQVNDDYFVSLWFCEQYFCLIQVNICKFFMLFS
jgi:hypothetical protein